VKTLHQISTATVLSLMLAVSVFGGHIETPGAPAPHSTLTSTTEVTTDTSMLTTDVTTDIVLTVVSVVYP
jgi:hypothetical protein